MESYIHQLDGKELENAGNDLAICCMSGGYKNAFAHGVLKAFEENGFKAKVYAACFSSVLIAAYAAMGKMKLLDLSVWSDGYAISREKGNQSEAMLQSIEKLSADLFSDIEIPSSLNGATIEFIKPDCELKDMGVDFYTITGDDLNNIYEYGYKKGIEYITDRY